MNDSEISRLSTSSTGDRTPWTISAAGAQIEPGEGEQRPAPPEHAVKQQPSHTDNSFRSQSPRPTLLAGQHDVERGA